MRFRSYPFLVGASALTVVAGAVCAPTAGASAVAAAPTTATAPAPIPVTEYKVVAFDSQAAPYPGPHALDGTAAAAVDGDYGSQWASAFTGDHTAMPHWLTIDVGRTATMTGLQYAVKVQSNGPVKDYAVYTTNDPAVAASSDLAAWGAPTATGSLTQPTHEAQLQTIAFATPVTARYVRFQALTAVNGSSNASIGELRVLAAPTPAKPLFTVKTESVGTWGHPDDTPANLFLDTDGSFRVEQAHALYGAKDPRAWSFFTGTTLDDIVPDTARNTAAAPDNPADRNNETTIRCNASPTGRTATPAPTGSGYDQRNYCDLTSIWVDPDTGHWYGLVHNEFTPQPFGDGLHFDAIDYAVSTDKGYTWTIKDHVVTSPYSTTRGDTNAFPQQTYDYGDGDPRLYADTTSGYFYMYYGSRIVDKGGSWKAFYSHVARSPISAKMAPGSWQKYYDGQWSQPGLGGKESNLVPVGAANQTGYTDPAKEYDPKNPGTTNQQVAAGTTPRTSPLFVMDIAYDAHLGLYIGEPENTDHDGKQPQQYYATRDLAHPQWFLLGDTGTGYTGSSWYRWFLDPASRTNGAVVGRTFRSYCSFGCMNDASGDYATVSIDGSAPASPVTDGGTYTITASTGKSLGQRNKATSPVTGTNGSSPWGQWTFTATGDGAWTITNAKSGQRLGVDSAAGDAGRAWGTPTLLSAGGSPTVGQQWWLLPVTNHGKVTTNTFRVVNRYSGLQLSLGTDTARTQPARTWDATGAADTVDQQTIHLAPARKG